MMMMMLMMMMMTIIIITIIIKFGSSNLNMKYWWGLQRQIHKNIRIKRIKNKRCEERNRKYVSCNTQQSNTSLKHNLDRTESCLQRTLSLSWWSTAPVLNETRLQRSKSGLMQFRHKHVLCIKLVKKNCDIYSNKYFSGYLSWKFDDFMWGERQSFCSQLVFSQLHAYERTMSLWI
jgi:hypothetical protein